MSTGAERKRPAIRLKSATPPRTTEGSAVVKLHRLPPPRPPAPRPRARGVLQLVPDEDASGRLPPAASVAPAAPNGQGEAVARAAWSRPAVILLVLAVAGTAFGAALSRLSSHADPPKAGAVRSGIALPGATGEPSPPPAAGEPSGARAPAARSDVPTFDVKSLPPAAR